MEIPDANDDDFLFRKTKNRPLLFHNRDNVETEFRWHIKNFEMCPDKWSKQIKSPEFGIYNNQNPKFQLLLYPGGVNEKNFPYISVYIVKTSFDEEDDFSYSCKIGVITTKDKEQCFSFRSTKLTRGEGKGRADFFRKEKFQSEKEIFLPDGNLTIYCELNAIKVTEFTNYSTRFQLQKLSDIYSVIHESEKYCDLYLHVGEKTFKVHKAILEARFPSLLKNVEENRCKIDGITTATMSALLRYIYTGVLNIGELNLFEIHSANYDLPTHFKNLLLENQKIIEVATTFQKTVISFSWKIENLHSLDSSKPMHYALIGDYNMKSTWFDIFLTRSSSGDIFTVAIKRFSKECKRIICTIKASDVSKTFEHTYDSEDKWTLPNFALNDKLDNKTPDVTSNADSTEASDGTSDEASDANSDGTSDEALNADSDESSDAASDAASDTTSNVVSDTVSDEIILNFEIAVSNGSSEVKLEKKELVLNSTNKTVKDLDSLHKDVINILNLIQYPDVTLMVGKDKIPAHKFLLSARSTVFCEIFESESAKKKNYEIIIDNLDVDVIKDMLYYMYRNEVKFTVSGFKHIRNMHSAAIKYNLPELKEECMNVLKPNFSAETAGEILIFADEYKDNELKELVYKYVCNHPQEIANSKEWEKVMLMRSDLAAEVIRKTLLHLASK